MSEYQYYEFRALDRRLTKEEMAELRAVSSRAEITPTRFVNEYNYGNFRGDPIAFMEHYFDAHIYVANWGTHELMFGLPAGILDLDTVSRYETDQYLDVFERGNRLLIAFHSEKEDYDYEEGEGWLDELIPLREDLQRGDLRALYLGWLASVYYPAEGYDDELDDEVEPPVPAGLRELTPALRKLAEFLRIPHEVIEVAAARSGTLRERPSQSADLTDWVRALPEDEKVILLVRLVEGDERSVKSELVRRFRQGMAGRADVALGLTLGTRTITEIGIAARDLEEARRREEQEHKAKEQARRQREQAARRAAYLDDLATRTDETWRRIEFLVDQRKPQEYDQAVTNLKDLREVATRTNTTDAFYRRLIELRTHHAK